MAWSTRQLAELAGTTVNTVRHYHSVGLLQLPGRASNGYKQYGVPHLLRLLQIRRLVELGLSLDQVAALDRDDRDPEAELDALDAELAASVERMTRAREELAQLRRHRAPADTPTGFAPVAEDLSATQRSLLKVYASVFDAPALQEFGRAIATPDPAEQELERLPVDADEATVDALAARLVAVVRRTRAQHPGLDDPLAGSTHGAA
uniref:MerR family transcriptional regulator n=1 Tax=Desertihabitans aurantiacus TaxID=2282477 RepID=UPI000DF7F874